jgi:hypothetical protein
MRPSGGRTANWRRSGVHAPFSRPVVSLSSQGLSHCTEKSRKARVIFGHIVVPPPRLGAVLVMDFITFMQHRIRVRWPHGS